MQEGKPDRIADLLEEAAIKLEEYEMGCVKCEKLKDALVSLVQEGDPKNLDYMKQYLEKVLEKSGKNDDVERSLYAISVLLDHIKEEENEGS